MKITKKEKTRVLIIFLSIVFLTIALITSVIDNIKLIHDNKETIENLEVSYIDLIEEEEVLKSELVKLSDPYYLVRYAKEKYLYSIDGEIIFKFE